MHKELPLLSSLFAGNIKFEFSDILNEKEGQPQLLSEKDWNMDNIRNFKEQNAAPEFSNGILRSNEIDKDNLGTGGLEGSKSSSHDFQTSEATKFGNQEQETATKNSNSDEKRRRERDLNPRGPHGPQAI